MSQRINITIDLEDALRPAIESAGRATTHEAVIEMVIPPIRHALRESLDSVDLDITTRNRVITKLNEVFFEDVAESARGIKGDG